MYLLAYDLKMAIFKEKETTMLITEKANAIEMQERGRIETQERESRENMYGKS